MKKIALLLIFSSLTTFMIAAATDIMGNPGDPKKTDQQPTFSLASGYFSLFNIFTKNPVTPDSTKVQNIWKEPKLVLDKK